MLRAGLVLEALLEDAPGLDQRAATDLIDIGADDRELGAGKAVLEEVQAVVELVVAERAALIGQGVHRGDHRMGLAGLEPLLVGDEIAERGALQEVAIVEEKAVLRLCLRRLDQVRGLGEADRVVGRVAKIVIRHDVDVEVAGLQQPQLESGRRLRRQWCGQRSCCGDGGPGLERVTAAETGGAVHHRLLSEVLAETLAPWQDRDTGVNVMLGLDPSISDRKRLPSAPSRHEILGSALRSVQE